MTKIEKQGRRYYILGNTYSIKDQLRSAGAKWDAEKKAWWTAKKEVADRFAGAEGSQSSAVNGGETGGSGATGASREAPGSSALVAARVKYKGKAYYALGKFSCGRVDVIQTKDGAKWLLSFRDGSKSFWASRLEMTVEKYYVHECTIGGLRAYAERAKASGSGQIEDGYYRRGGSILAKGCATCASLGEMCPQCEHDFY